MGMFPARVGLIFNNHACNSQTWGNCEKTHHILSSLLGAKNFEISSQIVWVTLGESFCLCQSPFNHQETMLSLTPRKLPGPTEMMLETLPILSK